MQSASNQGRDQYTEALLNDLHCHLPFVLNRGGQEMTDQLEMVVDETEHESKPERVSDKKE